MTIDATFWVAVSFVIFFGGLTYLKVPHKLNDILSKLISDIKRDLSKIFLLKSGEASANENVLLCIAVDGNSLISLLEVVLVLFISIEIDLFFSFVTERMYPLSTS